MKTFYHSLSIGCVVLGAFLLLHCGPPHNTCTPDTIAQCTCSDGQRGTQSCQDGRLSPCLCKTTPTNHTEPTNTKEATPGDASVFEPVISEHMGTEQAQPDTGPDTAQHQTPDQPVPDQRAPERSTPDTSTTDSPCPTGQSLCGSRCVDTQSSALHCGACDKACPAATNACVGGTCRCIFSKRQLLLDHFGGKVFVAISPNGQKMAFASTDNLSVYDRNTHKELQVYGKGEAALSSEGLFFSSENTVITYNSSRNSLRVRDLKQKSISGGYPHKKGVLDAISTNDGKLLASASLDQTVLIHTQGQTKPHQLNFPHTPLALAFCPNQKYLAVSLENKEIQVYDTSTWKLYRSLKGGPFTDNTDTLAFHKDNKRLIVGTRDAKILIADITKGTWERTIIFQGLFPYPVYKVALSPDGKWIASAWEDRTAKIHDIDTGQLLQTIPAKRDPVYSLAFTADGKRLLLGTINRASLWGCGP